MTISYIPKDVLSAPVDPYYFFWAPLKIAMFNFKAAYSNEKTEIENKVDNKALETLSKLEEKPASALSDYHFYLHTAAALLMIIPILNFVPFCCFIIKAKEGLIPEVYQDNKKQKEETKSEIKQDKLIIKEEKPEGEETTIAKQVKILPEEKNTAKEERSGVKNEQSKTSPNALIDIPETKPLTPQTSSETDQTDASLLHRRISRNNSFETKTPVPTDINTDAPPPLKRASSKNISPRVLSKMKVFQGKIEEPFNIQTENSLNVHHATLTHAEINGLEDDITKKYYFLFPDESTEKELRKSKEHREFKPTLEEKGLIEKLLLNYPGHTVEPKLKNAEANLDELKNQLITLFGKEKGDFPIQTTFSDNLFVRTEDNPSEALRLSIFSKNNEDFKTLLNKLKFSVYHDVIRVEWL